MAITPRPEPKPRRRGKRKKKRDPARLVRAENLLLHLEGKLESLRYSNHPDAPARLIKVQRVIDRCRRLLPEEAAGRLESSWA